eukprot:TRINITY_DN66145_c5_g4_i1.p1 TRINITY_DN66145_c5_g4~~TRINITY_DN66145_c5_g4_i1.p1  ORF type:complete len:272 (-),score=101.05 TRINITY_DN66145_c5_g4_i1:109-888(-)
MMSRILPTTTLLLSLGTLALLCLTVVATDTQHQHNSNSRVLLRRMANQHHHHQSGMAAAAAPAPAGAGERQEALLTVDEHKKRRRASKVHKTKAKAKAKSGEEKGPHEPGPPCQVCISVLERLRQGIDVRLDAVCVALFNGQLDELQRPIAHPDFGMCMQVINAITSAGEAVMKWWHLGCVRMRAGYPSETITPCPPQVMCTALTALDHNAFCDKNVAIPYDPQEGGPDPNAAGWKVLGLTQAYDGPPDDTTQSDKIQH